MQPVGSMNAFPMIDVSDRTGAPATAAGRTGLTISQAAGTYKTSGRTHTEQITITAE